MPRCSITDAGSAPMLSMCDEAGIVSRPGSVHHHRLDRGLCRSHFHSRLRLRADQRHRLRTDRRHRLRAGQRRRQKPADAADYGQRERTRTKFFQSIIHNIFFLTEGCRGKVGRLLTNYGTQIKHRNLNNNVLVLDSTNTSHASDAG